MHSLVRDNHLESDIGTRKNGLFYKNRNSTGSVEMRILALALTLFVSACTSIEDVSNKDFVKINKGSVLTTKPLFLCDYKLSNDLNNQLVVNYGFKECQSGNHLKSIPINSTLIITKVVKQNRNSLFSIDRWFLLGTFEGVKFYYKLDWVQQSNGTFFKQVNNVPWR